MDFDYGVRKSLEKVRLNQSGSKKLAIRFYRKALSTESDSFEKFFYYWKVLEVLAKPARAQYRWDRKKEIQKFLSKHLGNPPGKDEINKWYDIRNDIAHGSIDEDSVIAFHQVLQEVSQIGPVVKKLLDKICTE